MYRGYTKHWRRMWDNPVLKNPNRHTIFCYLLDHAEHGMKCVGGEFVKKGEQEMRSVFWKGARLFLKPGQIDRTIAQICADTGCDKSSTERSLKILENEGMIEKRKGNKFCIYTVCNYKNYQMTEKPVTKPARNQRETSDVPTKNDKTEETDNNYVVPKKLSSWLHRQGKGKGYEQWLLREYGSVLDEAWKKAVSGRTVSTAFDLVELCKTLSNA